MELKLDTSKVYAIALEGGGARGAYQVGAWKALCEAGIKYNAVSGCSVGALNGALMAMRNLETAEELWLDMHFSRVMNVDDKTMSNLIKGRLLSLDFSHIHQSLKRVISEGGFDVTPLRNLIAESVDYEKIISEGVDFYISTYSLTDKIGLDLRASDLNRQELCNMLLASAYFPAFKNEPLGGKKYTDGGAFNVFPISPLIDNGYKDIIAIRLFGLGVEKRVKIPNGVMINTIAPTRDLGNMMDFDAEPCRNNFKLGYYDAKRTLYGLYGIKYYIDRTLTEKEAYDILSKIATLYFTEDEPLSLRQINEVFIPKISRELTFTGDYYDMLIDFIESVAHRYKIDEFKIMTDRELLDILCNISKTRRTATGPAKYISGGKWYE